MKLKETSRFFLFITISSLFVGIFFTSSDFITIPAVGIKDRFTILLQWGVVCAGEWLLIYFLSTNKYIFAVIFPLLSGFSSVLAYFRYSLNTILTPMIYDAAIHNDAQTSADLITPALIFYIFLSLIISIGFVYYRWRKVKVKKQFIHIAISLTTLFLFINLPTIKRPLSHRIPFNLYFIPKMYYENKKESEKYRPSLSESVVCLNKEPLTVTFVLGESLRADHLGINGYERNTTPYLSNEDIISFTNIYCEETYTNTALPRILTRADSLYPERAYTERSFIDLFNACNYHTSWLANQEAANSYIYFMHECDTLIHVNIDKSSYTFDKWMDDALFPAFDEMLSRNVDFQFILLHTIGSHWIYNSHYTDDFEYFRPITRSKIISSNTKEEMINSYDNTVLYTDFFLYNLIQRLRARNAVLIYLSDHGESLGENGVWLHAANSPPIHFPACIVWMSETYKNQNPAKYEAAQANREKHYTSDFLFHSILDAAGIQSSIVEAEVSIFTE